jgi:hypothetical protein
VPQAGHADPGDTMEAWRGILWMQTFKKLPTHAPKIKAGIRVHISWFVMAVNPYVIIFFSRDIVKAEICFIVASHKSLI